MSENMSKYFLGKELYGDEFSLEEIEDWYEDEAEGYANLGASDKAKYKYIYDELNKWHGFKYILKKNFNEVLGVGSAYGHEFEPIINRIDKITILDPSESFSNATEILGSPCKYVKPNADGNMPFDDYQFDLITSLGVMHHIPNVSHVMSECYRCLNKGGVMLLREPIISMGDWTKPRKGLTRRERGIPINIIGRIVRDIGFDIKHESLCFFPLVMMLSNKVGVAAYDNYIVTMADALLSRVFSWNIKYHRTKFHEKFAPTSIYYVLEKQ
tara:strand:+ start:807 stop:1616 length:810 start_codon:yes stop_codon:yes gene_type:complete